MNILICIPSYQVCCACGSTEYFFSMLFVVYLSNGRLHVIAVMHDLRMIHTDLKPENILLVSPDYVKVPDYRVLLLFLFLPLFL